MQDSRVTNCDVDRQVDSRRMHAPTEDSCVARLGFGSLHLRIRVFCAPRYSVVIFGYILMQRSSKKTYYEAERIHWATAAAVSNRRTLCSRTTFASFEKTILYNQTQTPWLQCRYCKQKKILY